MPKETGTIRLLRGFYPGLKITYWKERERLTAKDDVGPLSWERPGGRSSQDFSPIFINNKIDFENVMLIIAVVCGYSLSPVKEVKKDVFECTFFAPFA